MAVRGIVKVSFSWDNLYRVWELAFELKLWMPKTEVLITEGFGIQKNRYRTLDICLEMWYKSIA